ncbi:MAG: PAS domain S-box protein [Planctomycetes bacterium]|nr:PAS domain S-box protein [Planctomycetota bacterium]
MDIDATEGHGMSPFLCQLLDVFEELQAAVYVADMETYELLYVNSRTRNEFGADIIGRKCYEVFQAGQGRPCPFCTNHRLLRDGRPAEPYIWEFRNTRNGHLYRCIDKAFDAPGGRLVRMEIALDITDARRLEDERDHRLRTEETLLRISMRLHDPQDLDAAIEEALGDLGRLISASRAYIFEIHDDGLLVSNTHEWLMEGLPSEKAILQGLDLTALKWWKAKLERGEVIAESDVNLLPDPERTMIQDHGVLSILAVPMYLSNRLFGFMGFAEHQEKRVWRPADIRILRTAAEIIAKEISRHQSEARHRALFTGGHDAVFVSDREGRIIDANQAASHLTGIARESLPGMRFAELIAPADRSSAEDRLRGPQAGLGGTFELRMLGPRGETREAILASAWIEVGRERFLQLVLRDISVRRSAQRERERLQLELFQAQKLEAVGRLAGGIAHDFNNILGGISACSALLRVSVPEGDGIAESIDAIEECVERAAMLTRNLLDFASARPPLHRPVALREVVEKTLAIVRRTVGRSIHIETVIEPEIPLIHGDEAQLVQCVLNLCLNARDAMPMGGTLRIALETRELGEDALRARPACAPGTYAAIHVSDTGMGIPPEIQMHIFEPFFTTKEKGKGVGLGLPTVYGIIQSHDGFLDIESQSGRGSRFSLYLPAAGRPADDDSPSHALADVSGTEAVLLVDDDATILESVGLWLTRMGYHVFRVPDAERAIMLLRARPDAVDIAVIDLNLPGMDGHQAIREIRSLRPDLPVIAWSGLGGHGGGGDVAGERVRILAKPCPPAALAREIRRILSAQPGPDAGERPC